MMISRYARARDLSRAGSLLALNANICGIDQIPGGVCDDCVHNGILDYQIDSVNSG